MKKPALKKTLALLATLCLTAGLISGCGQTTTSSSTATSSGTASDQGSSAAQDTGEKPAYERNEKGYPDLKGETFRIWFPLTEYQAQYATNLDQYAVIQQLAQELNCKFDFMHPPVGQERDNFSIMMAGGDWPDMIFGSGVPSYYPGGLGSAMADGIMYDVTPYVNDTNTPNFMKKIMNDPVLKKWFVDDEGRVIRLGSKVSGSEEVNLDFFGFMARKDYLDATGMENPVTIDDWHQMLTKMKTNGVQYPLALNATGWNIQRNCNAFASAYGIALDWFVKDDGKTVSFGPAEPAYKDYLTTMNQWYQEGLINQDFPNQTTNDTQAMLAAGQVGTIGLHLMDYQTKYFVTNESVDPATAMVPLQFPMLKAGDPLSRFRPASRNVNDEKTITASAKNPLACMYLLDALYIDDIDQMLQFGVEGVAFDMVDGIPVSRALSADQPKEIQLQGCPSQWHTTEDAVLKSVLIKYSKGSCGASFDLWNQCGIDGNLPTAFLIQTQEEAAIQSKYNTDLNTYVDEMMLKFITGTESLGNFDQYVAQLEKMHYSELLGAKQAAFDRYLSR